MGDKNFFSLDGPLDSIPNPRQMRVANLQGFQGLVRGRGGDPRALLERHDIDPQVMRDPDHFVDCRSVVELFEDCSRELNDPLFGLDLGELQQPDVYGCVAALCRAAPTVRDSITSFIDYIPVTHAPTAMLELVESGETAEIRWQVGAELGVNDQANYKAALLNLKLLREVAGRGFQPHYVNLAVSARRCDSRELERRLGSRFNRTPGGNVIAFPAAILDQPVKSANRTLYGLLGGYLEKVKAAARRTLPERVEDYIRGAVGTGNCSIERCALKLDISVRTLQAQLAESGVKFSDVLEAQRFDMATGYLAQPLLSLDNVADMLGYSDQSSFGRAFRRWTGMTPRLYRQKIEASRGVANTAAFSLAVAKRSAGL